MECVNTAQSRMKALLAYLVMQPTEFAKETGLKRQQIADVKAGRIKTMPLAIVDACRKRWPNVSSDWLLSGVGEMIKVETIITPPTQDPPAPDYTETINKLIAEMAEERKMWQNLYEQLNNRYDRMFAYFMSQDNTIKPSAYAQFLAENNVSLDK